MTKAGMLFRVSSVGQEDGYSLQDQQHDCRTHAAKQGYDVDEKHVWNDGAQKSWTLNRPGLQAAIQAIRDGEIEVLIVGRFDRFSRNQMQQSVVIYEIEQIYGGHVESADPKEQLGKDATGVFLRSLFAYNSERELEKIVERTQRGRQARAQSGKLIASPFPLYGYLWADQHVRRGKSRYVVDPETARVVQRIFLDAASGMKLRTIARQMTAEGIPTPARLLIDRGYVAPNRFAKMTGDWTKQMIIRICDNPAYIGQYVAYRTLTKIGHERTPDGQVRVQSHTIMRPKDDHSRVVLSAQVCPAIVEASLFHQVQQQLTINKVESSRNSRNSVEYLLRSGMAICGYCGSNMNVNTSGPVGKKVHVYRCGRANTSTVNRCEGGSFVMTASVVDEAVWSTVIYLFSDSKRIRAVLETQLAERTDEDARRDAYKRAVEGKMQEVEAQLDNATQAVLTANNPQSHAMWTGQVDHLMEQKAALQKELVVVVGDHERRRAAFDYLRIIEDWCEALGPEIINSTYEEKRYLLRGLKTKVTCWRMDHDPRFLIEWDLSRLQEPLRKLLPSLTDKDMAHIYESNNTYFRHQSPDYVPGTGFVAVSVAEE